MKRHEALVQLSRDHHFGLLLCWKLKEGLKREVSPERMSKYVKLFYNHNLRPHFEEEEQMLFPLLGNEHPLIKEALSEHRQMEKMISDDLKTQDEINSFQEILNKHIRKEEREIFPEIERNASDEELKNLLQQNHPALKEPDYDDIFWK